MSLIGSEPAFFRSSGSAWVLPRPTWGTCPFRPDDPEDDGFYLAENGVTVLCPDAPVALGGRVDGVDTYMSTTAGLEACASTNPAALAVACTSRVSLT